MNDGPGTLTERDFADLFGEVGALPASCMEMIRSGDFRHRPLDPDEREATILSVLDRIDAGEFSEAGPDRIGRWEAGWAENLATLRAGGGADALVPRYIRSGLPVRLRGRYVMPANPEFELRWYEVFLEWLFRTYITEGRPVYEFGCGSGINLARLAGMHPGGRYVGCDWATSSKEIVDELGRRNGWDMEGRIFDFFHPDASMGIEAGAVVLTIGALEQTGTMWGPFLDHLLRFRPALCVHVEPVVEWYGAPSLEDYAARRFHRARRYWEGFPAALAGLADAGRAEIVRMRRSWFGSLLIEGYSQIVWRPL